MYLTDAQEEDLEISIKVNVLSAFRFYLKKNEPRAMRFARVRLENNSCHLEQGLERWKEKKNKEEKELETESTRKIKNKTEKTETGMQKK